ncbi:hypothetical protein JTB14_001943 [Gonioctena quinquepunctata]|nr:hypothetical protein JTB14_001943 [Gonioctena quinquepunctata]
MKIRWFIAEFCLVMRPISGLMDTLNQNCRISGDEQPKIIQEQPLHPAKCTVWCGLWAGGIIRPYFVKNQAGQNVTINGIRYRAMLTDYLLPEHQARDVGDIWIQHDGANSTYCA